MALTFWTRIVGKRIDITYVLIERRTKSKSTWRRNERGANDDNCKYFSPSNVDLLQWLQPFPRATAHAHTHTCKKKQPRWASRAHRSPWFWQFRAIGQHKYAGSAAHVTECAREVICCVCRIKQLLDGWGTHGVRLYHVVITISSVKTQMTLGKVLEPVFFASWFVSDRAGCPVSFKVLREAKVLHASIVMHTLDRDLCMIIWLHFSSAGNEASMPAPWGEIWTVQSYRRPTQQQKHAKTWNRKWNANATFISNSNKHLINRLNTMLKGATFQAPTGCQWQTLETSWNQLLRFRKNVDYWKKNTVDLYSPHWKNPFKHWKKKLESVLRTFLQLTWRNLLLAQYLQGLGIKHRLYLTFKNIQNVLALNLWVLLAVENSYLHYSCFQVVGKYLCNLQIVLALNPLFPPCPQHLGASICPTPDMICSISCYLQHTARR